MRSAKLLKFAASPQKGLSPQGSVGIVGRVIGGIVIGGIVIGGIVIGGIVIGGIVGNVGGGIVGNIGGVIVGNIGGVIVGNVGVGNLISGNAGIWKFLEIVEDAKV